MREFFKGWRRKLGCATLVLALAFTGGWIRSLAIYDRLSFGIGSNQYDLFSSHGGLTLWIEEFQVPHNEVVSAIIQPNESQYPDIHYSVLVLPLTLLSAYLILWKPRKRMGPEHA